MNELIPLLILIVIVNVLKYMAEKGKKPPARPTEEQPGQEPTSIEDFFEEIAERLQPQPRKLPDWPEEIERPDYLKEAETFEEEKIAAVPKVMEQPKPPTMPEITTPPPALKPIQAGAAIARKRVMGQTAAFKIPVQGTTLASMPNLRIATPPVLRSAAGKTRFELRTRDQLKQSLIASMVFGQPRAYDQSFHNTLAK